MVGMVLAVEGYRNLQPLQVGWFHSVDVEDFSPNEILVPSRRSCRRSTKDHVHHAIFTWVHSPRAIVVVGGWPSLLGWIRRSWLEGAVDVVLDEPAVLERVLHGDLVVQSWHI
jgi:hypothetical protein